ncbi:MAG: ABC transporter permease [Actinomycetota bacterium]|nr:ABC transporter permease [Actinomycetota bacterium]
MSFLTLIFRNLIRHRTRSLLTALGISIGIATIVTLGILAAGLESSFEDLITTGDADFIVGQANAADLIVSSIAEKRVRDVRRIAGVDDAVGVSMGVIQQENIPYFMMLGIKRADFDVAGINITGGRAFKAESTDEIVLGKIAASNFEKQVGDQINIGGEEFLVTGIYETGNVMQDGGAFGSLKTVQKLFKREDEVSMIFVKVARGADINEVADRIEKTYPGKLVTVKSVDEVSKVDRGFKIISGGSWAISVLAIIIGGIGVMNTMIMSVFERTREIGVLRALGWKRRRILNLILGETLFISLAAAVIGIILGIIGIKAIMLAPAVKNFLDPVYSKEVFIRALLVALLVSIVGGFYPAYKASKLSPMEALRYE